MFICGHFLSRPGNVGIGTTNPNFKLSIVGPSAAAGTGSLQLSTPGLAQGERSSLSLYSTFQGTGDSGPRRTADVVAGFNGSAWGNEYLAFNVGNNGTPNDGQGVTLEKVRIQSNGNVGIGTPNPQHLLHVAGTIGAEEILVTSTGADYVFEPSYRLKPLSEVASYIQANHHLPDVPSAEEVKQNGMGLGEMETKLLAKIEELTLHVIQEHERNDRLERENAQMQERLARLEGRSSR